MFKDTKEVVKYINKPATNKPENNLFEIQDSGYFWLRGREVIMEGETGDFQDTYGILFFYLKRLEHRVLYYSLNLYCPI